MLAQPRAAHMPIFAGPESHGNGKFAGSWIQTATEGELWQPMICKDGAVLGDALAMTRGGAHPVDSHLLR